MKNLITNSYACLNCRKAFKKHRYKQLQDGNWEPLEYEVVCPQCGGKVFDAGDAFKAPKSKDLKAWAELKPLFDKGYRFNRDFGSPFAEPTKSKKTKYSKTQGLKSLFQLQARKRKKKAQQGGCT